MAGNVGVSSLPTTYKSHANNYKALLDTAFKKGKDYLKGVFYIDSTENYEDRIQEIGGVDEPSRWDDGDRASQTEIREGYETEFTQVRFGKELPIGQIAEKFQGKDVRLTSRGAKVIGARHYRLRQKSGFSLLGYGFADANVYLGGIQETTVSSLGADGKRLFSTLHPCSPDLSTTWSNALSDNGAVGEDALYDLIINIHNQLDDRGEKLYESVGTSGYGWYVPLDKFQDASIVVGSDKRSGTTDNDSNVFKGAFDGRPIQVEWIPFLDQWSTTAHFLQANDAVDEYMPLVMLESMPYYTDDYVDDATATAYVRGRCMLDTNFTIGRGIAGSQGTGTGTYSS